MLFVAITFVVFIASISILMIWMYNPEGVKFVLALGAMGYFFYFLFSNAGG